MLDLHIRPLFKHCAHIAAASLYTGAAALEGQQGLRQLHLGDRSVCTCPLRLLLRCLCCMPAWKARTCRSLHIQQDLPLSIVLPFEEKIEQHSQE